MRVWNNWTKATVINAMILVLIVFFTDMSYETNDDYAISVRTLMGDPYTFFVDYHVCRFLIWLQGLIPALNAFVLFQVAVSFIAFTCISALFLDKERSFMAQLIFLLIIAIYSFDHYSVIQFTKTSILVLTSGMLMLIDAMTERRRVGYYAAALMLFYIGSTLRIQNAYLAIAFAGLFLLFWVVQNRRRLIPEGYLRPAKLGVYLLLLLLLGGAFLLHQWSNDINVSTTALREYQKYNDERSWVIDYSDFKHYDGNRDKFDAMGLSENDLYLINNWYFDYDGAASYDNLKSINRVYAESRQASVDRVKRSVKDCLKNIVSTVRAHSSEGIQIIILMGIALSAMALMRPGYWLYIIALGVASLTIYLGLYYMGRPAYRAFYGVDLSATLWLLWYFDSTRYRTKATDGSEANIGPSEAVRALFGIAFALLLSIGVFFCGENSRNTHEGIVNGLRGEALTREISSNKDKVYLFATRDKMNLSTYATPMRAPDPDGNVFTFGGWGTLSPYLLGRMATYGLDNLFEDIIDNKDVYVIDNRNVDRMEEYLEKWYGRDGSTIRYDKVKDVDGTVIWQVVRE